MISYFKIDKRMCHPQDEFISVFYPDGSKDNIIYYCCIDKAYKYNYPSYSSLFLHQKIAIPKHWNGDQISNEAIKEDMKKRRL